jgi:exonuclease III
MRRQSLWISPFLHRPCFNNSSIPRSDSTPHDLRFTASVPLSRQIFSQFQSPIYPLNATSGQWEKNCFWPLINIGPTKLRYGMCMRDTSFTPTCLNVPSSQDLYSLASVLPMQNLMNSPIFTSKALFPDSSGFVIRYTTLSMQDASIIVGNAKTMQPRLTLNRNAPVSNAGSAESTGTHVRPVQNWNQEKVWMRNQQKKIWSSKTPRIVHEKGHAVFKNWMQNRLAVANWILFGSFVGCTLLAKRNSHIRTCLPRCNFVLSQWRLPSVALFNIVSINAATRSDTSSLLKEAESFNPDIICIQELKRPRAVQPIQISTLSDKRLLQKTNKTYKTAATEMFLSNRVGLIVYNNDIKVKTVLMQERFIKIRATFDPTKIPTLQSQRQPRMSDTHDLIIYSVYAPVDATERKSFFKEDILDLASLPNEKCSVIIAGNFNDFNNSWLDRHPPQEMSILERHWSSTFAPTLDSKGLLDSFRFKYPEMKEFSRVNVRKNTATRIDAIILSDNLVNNIQEVKHRTCSYSDHKFVICTLHVDKLEKATHDSTLRFRRHWKLHPNNCLNFHFQYESKERILSLAALENSTGQVCDIQRWNIIKSELRSHAKQVSYKFGYLNKDPAGQINTLRIEIRELEASENSPPLTHSRDGEVLLARQLKIKRERLNMLLSMFKAQQERVTKCQLTWDQLNVLQPQTLGHRHYNVILLRDPQLQTQTQPTGQPSMESTLEIVHNFYQNLFTPEITGSLQDIYAYLSKAVDQRFELTEEDCLTLLEPFSSEEALNALATCVDGKASGFDGLGFEYYKMIAEEICPIFADMCTSILRNPESVISFVDNQGHEGYWPILKGVLLFKKGNEADVRNYRPLSIMDTDLRWREKVILNRMLPLIAKVLPLEQTGFVPGRSMIDNVTALMLLIEDARYTGSEKAIMISLDQEKAYDRVNWEWLFATLTAMNFPQEWIASIRALYHRPAVQFIINNRKTNPILYKCGILQGGPLSVLLYIIALQPFLSTLRRLNFQQVIEFQGETAMLCSMGYADDILVIVPSLTSYRKLQDAIREYSNVSNAKFSEKKAIAIIPSPQIDGDQVDDETPIWLHEVTEPTLSKEDDAQMLGCFYRLDGLPPKCSLRMALGRLRRFCSLWSLRHLSLRTRVTTMSCNILSTLWHATQVCPLPEDYASQVNQIIAPFIFGMTKAPISFKQTCFPRKFGGLGIIEPASMFSAQCGRMVARNFSDQSITGKAFRVAFLREIEQAEGDFFRLFTDGKFHRVRKMSPFWVRVYKSIRELGLSVNQEWNEYTDEEFLSLPFHLPGVLSSSVINTLAKRAIPSLFRLRIYSWKDIIHLDRARSNVSWKVLDHDRAKRKIFSRFRLLLPDETPVHGEEAKNHTYTNSMSAYSDIRKVWPTLWNDLPKGFKTRLGKVKRPASGGPLAPLVDFSAEFDASSIHDLIPWQNLTLGGSLCKDFTIKSGRRAALKAEVIIPNWNHLNDFQIPDSKIHKTWAKAWKLLNWASRPSNQYEEYWYLLHRRAPILHDLAHVRNEEGKTEWGNWEPLICSICQQRDSNIHGFFSCPSVNSLWQSSQQILHRISTPTAALRKDAAMDPITLADVVFAFEKIRNAVPKQHKVRVLLWHSAVLHFIWSCRQAASQNITKDSKNFLVEFNTDQPEWQRRIIDSIKDTVKEIHLAYKRLGNLGDFRHVWGSESELWNMCSSDDELTFITEENATIAL